LAERADDAVDRQRMPRVAGACRKDTADLRPAKSVEGHPMDPLSEVADSPVATTRFTP
jgi:hypothetical protein